jgi:hypothetical protein
MVRRLAYQPSGRPLDLGLEQKYQSVQGLGSQSEQDLSVLGLDVKVLAYA